MFPLRNLCILILLVLVQACSSGDEQTVSTNLEEEKLSFDSFRTAFDTIALPFLLPEQQTGQNVIDKRYIKGFFEGRHFEPAFGEERDVPDLAENADASKYFYSGRFSGSDFTALIIQKQENTDRYYYLCTFNTEGDFVDGMCIAFAEGDNQDKTERRAAINDDYSLQLMQLNTMGGKATEDPETRFFEVSAGGKINSLGDKGNSAAAI